MADGRGGRRAAEEGGLTPQLDLDLAQKVALSLPGVALITKNGGTAGISYVSPGFTQLTGYTLSDIAGRDLRCLDGPLTDDEATNSLAEALDTTTAWQAFTLNYRKSGEAFWNFVQLTPLGSGDGAYPAGSMLVQTADVTDRRAATI